MANIINGTDTGSGGLITTGDSSDELQLQTAETARVTLTNTAVVVNEGGNDVDFRVESDTDANAFFLEGSSGNVGMGTSSPSRELVVQRSGGTSIFAERTATFPGFVGLYATDLPAVAWNSSGSLRFATIDDVSGFTNFTERMRINTAGNLAFPNGQGIDFSASAGGGASSSILDDYEEGTWTPTLPNGGTLAVESARYVKIGQQVTVTCYVYDVAPTNNGSRFDIGGLPYANAGYSPSLYTSGSFGYVGDSNLSDWLPITGANLTSIYFHIQGSVPPRTNAQYLTAASGATDYIIMTITYFAAT